MYVWNMHNEEAGEGKGGGAAGGREGERKKDGVRGREKHSYTWLS